MTGDRVIRAGQVVSLAAVTGIAVALSYDHIRSLAEDYGPNGWQANVAPITVDGLILATSLVLVNRARTGRPTSVLAWLLLVSGIGATLAANIAHGWEYEKWGALISGWPALVAAGMFELAIREIRDARENGQNGTVTVADLPQFPEFVTDPEPVPDGWSVWETIEPEPVSAPLAAAIEAPETGDDPPAIETASPEPAVPVVTGPETDPELAGLVETARDRFAETISAGEVPSINQIRTKLSIGYPKAKAVKAALEGA